MAWPYKGGYAIVESGKKQGAIDLKGKVIIPFDYIQVTYLGDHLFSVSKD